MPRPGPAPSFPDEHLRAEGDRPALVIRRSARRRKTVSARWDGDRVLLQIPASMGTDRALRHAEELLPRLLRARARQGAGEGDPTSRRRSDGFLAERARRLARELLGDRVRPVSIRWVTNQRTRWGSTTPARGSVRISHQLWEVPDYVLDYVIHHELCHLIEASHGPRFRRLEARYPHAETARAYLAGYAHGRGQDPEEPFEDSPEESSPSSPEDGSSESALSS